MTKLAGRSWSLLLAVSLLASAGMTIVRYTRVQEVSARMFAMAGMSAWILALCALTALIATVAITRQRGFTPTSLLCLVPVVVALTANWSALAGIVRGPADVRSRQLSVLVQNVLYENESPDRAARVILSQGATVMVLVEYSQGFADAVDDLDFSKRYPYRWEAIRKDGLGLAVFSKLPISNTRKVDLSAPAVSLDLDVDGRNVQLTAVHVNAPRSVWDIPRWKSDMDALMREALRDHGARRIYAGDFNSTSGHLRYRKFLRSGDLRDAQDAAGRGFGGTWPAGLFVPSIMRLDHVLVTDHIGVAGFRRLPDVGSDHRGILAKLTF